MMRQAGAMAVAVAALLACCVAELHQEQDGREHNSADRYDASDYEQKEELADFLRFLLRYENRIGERNTNGLGGSSLLGRNLGLGSFNRVGNGGLGGTTMVGRNLHGIGGGSLLGSPSPFMGRDFEDQRYSRFVDSLGGGNLVRNLDSLGGGNLVRRNLDSLGGGNLVKKNLDSIGGPNLIKRNLDSLGGGNMVRNLDSLGGGNLVRNLDSIGGGHKIPAGGRSLVREAREVRHTPGLVPYLAARHEYASPYGGKHELWPMAAVADGGYYADAMPKRNFDEIDRSGLDTFINKRNFDEIDQTSMPFPYAFKRFYRLYSHNYLDTPVSSFDKKRLYRPDYPMDEIDLSQFPIGSKRSLDSFPRGQR